MEDAPLWGAGRFSALGEAGEGNHVLQYALPEATGVARMVDRPRRARAARRPVEDI